MKDSIPFDQFSLKWRFTQPTHNVLPDEVIDRFRVLGPLSALELHEEAMCLVPSCNTINSELYPSVISIDCSTDDEKVRMWLLNQLADLDQYVSVSWSRDTAAMVKLEDFCEYWDDFCYPSSDDVVVLPTMRNWVLSYFHEGKFSLGRRSIVVPEQIKDLEASDVEDE